jgi:hypothetical protein
MFTNEEYEKMHFVYSFLQWKWKGCCGVAVIFSNAEHLRTYTELRGRLVPSHKQMQNVNSDGLEMMMFW